MTAPATALHVPVYSLEETSRTGAAQFEVVRHEGLTRQQKELFFVPHRKDFYLLAFVKKATARHWIDSVPYTMQADTVYFSSPQQVFLKEEGTLEATAICFTQEFLDLETSRSFRQLPMLQAPGNPHELRLAPADVAFVEDLTGKLLAEFQQGGDWQDSMLLAYLRVLLIHLSRLYSRQARPESNPVDRRLFQQFRDLVDAHFGQWHDVARYAGLLHVSAGHLGERIKEQSGKTPLEHIHNRLLLEAKRLLFHTDASVKEIAFELGFDEASYFNRFFKRLTASTPAVYRSAIREKYQ